MENIATKYDLRIQDKINKFTKPRDLTKKNIQMICLSLDIIRWHPEESENEEKPQTNKVIRLSRMICESLRGPNATVFDFPAVGMANKAVRINCGLDKAIFVHLPPHYGPISGMQITSCHFYFFIFRGPPTVAPIL